MYVLPLCVYAHHLHTVPVETKIRHQASDGLEAEFQVVVSHQMRTGN